MRAALVSAILGTVFAQGALAHLGKWVGVGYTPQDTGLLCRG